MPQRLKDREGEGETELHPGNAKAPALQGKQWVPEVELTHSLWSPGCRLHQVPLVGVGTGANHQIPTARRRLLTVLITIPILASGNPRSRKIK